jgi:chromosome segregation ATPase
MSSENQYGRDLERAMESLARMLEQREELEVQIARTKRKIALLSQLCDETDTLAPVPDLDLGGLTEACRTVLRASRKQWMTIAEIQAGLAELGFPLEKYKAATASITTTVNRMVESKDVVENSSTSSEDATEYKWLGMSNRPEAMRNFAAANERHKRRFKAI